MSSWNVWRGLREVEPRQDRIAFRKGVDATAWLKTDYLPMQKLEKMRPSKSSELNAPVISPSACCA